MLVVACGGGVGWSGGPDLGGFGERGDLGDVEAFAVFEPDLGEQTQVRKP